MSRKKFPRCVGACRDGTQCGRRVIDGSQPPMCHLHSGAEHPSPIIPPSDEIDEIKILKRLARDPNPQVRLKAVDLLLDLKRKDEVAKPAPRPPDFEIERLTDEERTRFIALVDQFRALKEAIWTRDPQQRPDRATSIPAPVVVEPAPIVSPPVESRPDPIGPEEPEPEPGPRPLSEVLYPDAGFVKQEGRWVHPLGDEIGDQIRAGEIAFSAARDMTDAAEAQSRSLAVASTERRHDVEQWDASLNRSTRILTKESIP